MGVEWESVLRPETPVLEILFRGTVTYIALFLLLRLILRRQAGFVSVTDILLVVLIADAAQNAMADDYRSVPDGIMLVATIIFWTYAFDWLGYRVGLIGRLVHPPPLELISEGRELRRNMAREFITHEELMSSLRAQGIEELSQVRKAYMEGNGDISIITYEGGTQHGRKPRRPV